MIGVHIENPNKQQNIMKKSDIIQIFDTQLKNKEVMNFKKQISVHAPYTINIAKEWNEHSSWIIHLIDIINECFNNKNVYCVVVHLGKKLNLTNSEAYNNMYTSLLYILKKTKKTNMKILLETSAGQGTEMCYDLYQFAYFYTKFNNNEYYNRLGVCIDTCHIFAAGYDLTKKKYIDEYIALFDKLIGIKCVKLIHLNDSKNKLKSRVDRHERIGKGKIGLKPLIYIAKYFKELNVPIIIETSSKYLCEDIKLVS